MKRKIISSLILILLVVLGVLGYEYFGKAEMKSGFWGFSQSYDTLEDLKAEADLVVRAHIPLYFDIRDIGEDGRITKQAFYEAEIDEVFLDHTGQNFDEESDITVNQVIGFKETETGDYKSGEGMKAMRTGDYLLFLKKVTHPADGKVYYVSNSPHHLYKWKDKETFKNIASDELMEIKYSELMGGE